jgi:kinesin family protein 12
MDPREALILSLKREVNALKSENDHLKSALNFHSDSVGPQNESSTIGPIDVNERTIIPAAPEIDVEKLTELENNELSELVKLYMTENQALRQENADLYSTREMIMRDQEVVCRENERLLKKLEDVNS